MKETELREIYITENLKNFFFFYENKSFIETKQTLYNPTTRETKPYRENSKSDIRPS